MRASALLGDIAAQSLRPLMAHCHLGLGALYRRAGFSEISPYGEYVASSGTSVCMTKVL